MTYYSLYKIAFSLFCLCMGWGTGNNTGPRGYQASTLQTNLFLWDNLVLKPDAYITEEALGNLCTWIGPTSSVYSQEEQTLTGAQKRTIIQKGKATPKHCPVRFRVMTTNNQWTTE